MDFKVTEEQISKLNGRYSGKYCSDDSLYKSCSYDNTVLDDKTVDDVYRLYDKIQKRYPDKVKKIENSLNIYMASKHYDTDIIVIVGGLHGNEKSSVYGVAYSFNAILAKYESLLNEYSIIVVPCLNPVGFNANTREKGKVDLNRDFSDFTQEETRTFDSIVNKFKDRIKIILDSHNCGRAGDYYPFSFVAKEGVPNFALYEDVCLRLRLFLEKKYNGKVLPLCMIASPNSNTLSDYINKNGFIGHTLETPKSIKDYDDDKNYKEGCEITKDTLINAILLYTQANK